MIELINNISVGGLNREAAHSPWSAYESDTQALKREKSKYVVSLNGVYKFKLLPNPKNAGDFFSPGGSREGFTDINVPGHWELQGHSKPIYTNVHYPWPYGDEGKHMLKPSKDAENVPNPPFTPEDNPTGCYYKEFDVPQYFANRDVFLRFDGVEAAYKLWVNGEYVGYSEDSKLPTVFNITKYIKQGSNSMALQVARWAKATYLEDQDYWHISGIYGDVSLISKPAARINDYHAKATPSESCKTCGEGLLSVDASVSRVSCFADYTVKMSVFDISGTVLAQTEAKPAKKAGHSTKHMPTANTARLECSVPGITLWTPETPVLYTVVLSLYSPAGEFVDAESFRVGFKKIKIKNGVLHLNGKRLVIQGVNRHQHHYQTGRLMSREWMQKEIAEMKRMNINAVRTSHYPCSWDWYDLCDELGILVVCETNLETHGVDGQLAQDPVWAGLFLERAVRMVQTFKNHACIYSWSLGNESGVGPNHGAMAGFIREYDNTRLCKYAEGEPSELVSDVRGNMYAPINRIYDMLTNPNDNRPIILVEYLYQIRNAGGGMYHFREMTERHPRFQGGFVWDWQDKVFELENEHGQKYFGHGGDFGEKVTDPVNPTFMTNNGIVLGDLTWKPVAYEIKQAYAPIVVRPVSKIQPWMLYEWAKGKYEIVNRTYTKHLEDYEITVLILEDGHVVHEFVLDAAKAKPKAHDGHRSLGEIGKLAPGSRRTIEIDPGYELNEDKEYFIEFRVKEKLASFYAEAGYETGRFQYKLAAAKNVSEPVKLACTDAQAAKVDEDGSKLSLTCCDIQMTVNKKSGEICFVKNGFTYLSPGGMPCLHRPYSGMDSHANWGGMFNVFGWMRPGNTSICLSDASCCKNTVKLTYAITTNRDGRTINSHAENKFTLLENGDVLAEIFFNLNEDLAYVPRAGIEFVLPAGFEKLKYYGLGDNENFSDRKMSAYMGIHESTVTAQHFPFCPPSVCGTHGETRWVMLENENGKRLSITGLSPFHFDALHNTIEDYQTALHDYELPKRTETILHIDAAHGGIGGNMAWSSHLEPAHLVQAKPHHLRFVMRME